MVVRQTEPPFFDYIESVHCGSVSSFGKPIAARGGSTLMEKIFNWKGDLERRSQFGIVAGLHNLRNVANSWQLNQNRSTQDAINHA